MGPSLLDSSLFSVERDSGQPEGRKRIAQRFIAGSGQPEAVESRRNDRNHGLRVSLAGILSSLRDFRAADSEPSDKSLGYFRASLRDSRPAARRLRPCRGREGPAPFHRKQRGTAHLNATSWLTVDSRFMRAILLRLRGREIRSDAGPCDNNLRGRS